jgi:Legume lectin domain/Chitobiase/beta-hexosaminidase C-terminal domain
MRLATTLRNVLSFGATGKRRAIAFLAIASSMTLGGLAVLPADAQNVTTYHNDIGRTGQNLHETILTTSNVNATQFGRLFSQPVDGSIFAQPLYLQNVTIAGQQHNVVFVATENDSVYAFDADNNGGGNTSPLWMASMLTSAHGAAAGATAVPSSEVSTDIQPVVGITGTPVIDPTTNTLYVVSKSLEAGNAVQRLHALDVTSGAEKFGGPVVLTATVSGTGNGSVSGVLTFDPLWENQRPGLLLLNGIVYIGFAAHGDNGPWHGWILGYNAATLKQTGVFNASPNGVGSGFWMSGAGLAADLVNPTTQPYGRMFLASGNGDYTAASPYKNGMDFGDSILRLDLTNGVPTILDVFTPSNQSFLDGSDNDVGAGGLMVLPDPSPGSLPHLLVQSGKYGTTYLLNRENLGGYNTTDTVVQETTGAAPFGAWSSPAYWNGTVYYAGQGYNLGAFPLVSGQLQLNGARSPETYAYPGATPSISANGTTQGIVWAVNAAAYTTGGQAILYAHDATNVAGSLYASSTNSARDNPGPAVKFTVPTVANGKVYVGTANQVSVYGLLSGSQQAAAPVLTPGRETFTGSVSVTISDSTAGATIYYTTNGTTPTTSSTKYTGAITVSATETINAIASAANFVVSPVASATYTSMTQTSVPVFSVPSGTYTVAQTVTITDAISGAVIYYTTNGTTPTTSSTKYAGAITVSATETIEAIAVAPGLTSSTVASASYNILPAGVGFSFPQGFAGSQNVMIFNGSTALDDSRLQLTDGGASEEGTAWYSTPVNVQSFTTDFTFQLSNPAADGITFTIQNLGPTALGIFGAGLGYEYITQSVAVKFDLFNNSGEGADSTGIYTNGVAPTVPAIDLSSTGIDLHSDDTMAIHLVYNGTTLTMTITDTVTNAVYTTSFPINIPATVGGNTAYVGFTGGTGGATSSQKILTWSYVPGAVAPTVATPTFSVAAGTYPTAQSVTIADATSGATIYYTTNNTAPTTSSTKYTAAIPVSASETIQAIAVLAGSTNSAVASAAYTISPVLPTPVFNVAAGTYTTAQTVSITDATAGATIYYTTNNTTPTTSSTKYTGAITVSATETLKAIAVLTGSTNSAVASAAYTISTVLPTPVFNVAAGTYTTAQSVTITDATPGTTIYYTTNNTTPTTSSTKYTGAITVSATETIQAIAVLTGSTNSAVASAAYTISAVLPTPVFNVAAGTYTTAQTVSITDATPGTTIYYTTNGTTPTTSSTKYTGAITVSATETLKAIAVLTGSTNSAVASAAYTIQAAGVAAINFSSGFGSASGQMLLNGSALLSGTALQLTDGGASEEGTAWYKTPVNVQSFTTDFTFQLSNPNADGITFTIQNLGPTALGIFGTGLGYEYITQSVAVKFDLFNSVGEGPDSTGIYTNGVAPTLPATDLSSTGINLHSGDTMAVHLAYNGTTLAMTITDTVTNAVYSTSFTVNIPTAVGGNTAYVGFTGGTGGATATQKILTWSYTPGTTAAATVATPAFSVAAGTYAAAQSVAITDATAGATIYYTTNNTTPTTASTKYTAAIPVSATETIQAIAVLAGSTNSAVASAAYTIQASTPAISLSSGFASAVGQMVLKGSAQLSGTALAMTNTSTGDEASAAWYSTPMNVQSFTTDFSISLPLPTADGMTFTIQNVGSSAVGLFGSGLGYQGITKSVALKFDLFNNAGEGVDSIGIFTNGVAPTVPSTDLSSTGINLHSGDAMAVHLVYNGTTLTMTITDTVTKAAYTTSFTVNIPSVVGGNTAYVGFTAGTGAAIASQKILNWSYSN